MIHIEIEPVWRFKQDGDAQSILVMLDFLNEIRVTGKIGQAADRAQVSYRHAWNLIEKWSAFFEAPLVDRKQGRGTSLTPLGAKLVWAGQRLQARLGPQLQNLSAGARDRDQLSFSRNGLFDHPRPRQPRIRRFESYANCSAAKRIWASIFATSAIQNSLVSLAHDGCDLAGIHLPQGEIAQGQASPRKQGLADPERPPGDRPGDPRNGPDGQAREPLLKARSMVCRAPAASVTFATLGLSKSAANVRELAWF